jgi:pimeloyl-ACP methyl ester carboxylesterase
MPASTPPTLIFLHGPGQSPPAWQDVVERIDPERPMYAPWLKGTKPGEERGLTVPVAAADIANTMEMRGIERADLVGYSLGGVVALQVAADLPDRIAHLILVSTPALPSAATLKMQRRLIKLMPADKLDVPKELALQGIDAILQIEATVDLSRVRVPTLVVTAENDQTGAAETFAKEVHAVVRRLPAENPDLLTHAPAELAQVIEDFCADRLSDATA